MIGAVSEHFFGVIATVEYNDRIFIDAKSLKILHMPQCGIAFRSKIPVDRGVDDIIVKYIIYDGGQCLGILFIRVVNVKHLTEVFEEIFRIRELKL